MTTVSIVGGGIAGLALAARLNPRRFDVVVHEQRRDRATVGTLLAMWPDAQRVLAELGVLEDLTAGGTILRSMALRTGTGRVLAAGSLADVVAVSRVALLGALDSVVPVSVRRESSRVTEVPRGAELVIGADGVHSVVRRSAWGESSSAVLTPYLAVRGTLDRPAQPGTTGEYWGRGDLFGISPAGARGTNWYASFRSTLGPQGVSVPDALALSIERYGRHAPAVRAVLRDADPAATLAQRVWLAPPLRSYVRGRTALVGDAAHAMAPNVGRGACEALVDAFTLADLLNAEPIPTALRAYDRARVLRTQALRLGASGLMRLALAERGQPARDRLIGLAGRRLTGAEDRRERTLEPR